MSTAPLPGFEPEPKPFEPWIAFPIRALRDPDLTDLDRRILAFLVFLTGRRMDFTCAGNSALSAEMGVEEGSIRRALLRLERAGYIERCKDRNAGSTHRRIELRFRTWDPPEQSEQANTGRAPGCAGQMNRGRTLARAKAHPSARQGAPYGAPLFLIGDFEKERKSSKGDDAPAQGEKTAEGGAPQTCRAREVAPRAEAHQAETPPPPTAEQIASWHQWIHEGQPILVRIAQASLRAAGLPVPEPPTRPAESAPSGPAGAAQERQETTPTDPEAARTAQDRTRPPRDDRDEQSTRPTPGGQGEPPRPAPRPPATDLPELSAVNWSAMMQRCSQLGTREPKVLPGEDLLRAWVASGDPQKLEGVLNCWSAHWRDWQRISRDHWRSCLEEIPNGLVTVDEVLGVLADTERRQVKTRPNYFSHHIGDLCRLKREAQKTAPPA